MTRHFPWADGTECGDGKVCDRGVCSEKPAKKVTVSFTEECGLNGDAQLNSANEFASSYFCSGRWMAAGAAGVCLDHVHAHVEAASSFLKGNVPTQLLQMGGNTVEVCGSNIDPAT